jgi:riboflavin synthase
MHHDGDLSIQVNVEGLCATDLELGESIAVSGVCLTVVNINETLVTFDVSVETLERSTLDLLQTGTMVNLERAMMFNDRYGGHLVTGHIDGVGYLESREDSARSVRMTFSGDRDIAPYMAEKGSITVDGVSLTVNGVHDLTSAVKFDVNVVPHTLEVTTLGERSVGDRVHLEADLVARYLDRLRHCS